ncbi:MAG: TonB-dependent receptor [Pyrinomonadaceae bacterium]
MLKLKELGLAFVCIVGLVIINADELKVSAQVSSGTIQGVVLDPNRSAVPDASVEIVQLKRRVTTDLTGIYRFSNIDPGEYSLKVVADGYNSAAVSRVIVTAGATTSQDLVFTVLRGSVNQVDVIGTDSDAIAEIPGSVALISRNELRRSHPIDANEVLRRVTGVHVREDSGPVGLRLNIGIRGLNPDRSRQILVLEDGIPLAIAPYGEPELYYSPPINRMQRVEILKGSGSILYGPQTIGGVINFITSDPPQRAGGSFELIGGQRDYLNFKTNYGGTIGKLGAFGSFLRKQGDGFRSLYFGVTDFTGKLYYALTDRQTIGAKLSLYSENSNSTYLGLSQPQFERDPNGNSVPGDLLSVRRYFGSVNHQYVIDSKSVLNTTAYAYNTVRNWRRQDFDRSRVAGRNYIGVEGDETIPGGAIFLRNSTGNRNREFNVAGLESRFTREYSIGGNRSNFTGGAHYVYEKAFDDFIVGSTATSSTGVLRDSETRPARGVSAFAQNRFTIGKRFTVTPGLRYENYSYKRNITRARVNGLATDVDLRGEDNVSALIPGIGFTFQPIDRLTLFAGAHRGFAPPRVKDAVSNSGVSIQLDAELSWNYEAGARYSTNRGFSAEATFFELDFENQIIPDSQSGGATSTLTNAGETLHRGFELQTGLDFGRLFKMRHGLTADLRHTRLSIARFENGIFGGNRLPYAPKKVTSFITGYRHPRGFGTQYDVTFVSSQFADNNETIAPSANGEIGLIPSYTLHNISFDYERRFERFSISPFVTVKNLTNRVYISSRAPQGIQPGLFRQANIGLRVQF